MDASVFTKEGKYLMLALDHRSSFLKLINPKNPQAVTKAQAIKLKRAIIQNVHELASGILIDADYGLPAYQGFSKPFLLPLEKSGYRDEQGARLTELQYDAAFIKKHGASGAKLLLYFNPELATADQQLATAREALADCNQHSLPLFIEIVTYLPNQTDDQIQSQLVMASVERFLAAGIMPSVFKLEYPGSAQACQKITAKLGSTPWILLTRGEQFDEFKQQLEVAIHNGAAGFLAGRALWQEVCRLEEDMQIEFLNVTLPNRFKKISEVALG